MHKKGYDEHEKHHGISRQLSGKRNARLYSSVPVENNYTAAWTDPGYIYPETNVTAPSEEIHAQTEQMPYLQRFYTDNIYPYNYIKRCIW